MKTARLTALFLYLASYPIALRADDITLDSFHSNGRLTWTNTFSGLYTIQWAPSLSSNTSWNQSWNGLQAITSGGSPQTTVEVPMFYRVKCETNPFTLFPVGHGAHFLGTNSLVNNWTQQVTCVARTVLPSVGKEFTLLEWVDPRGTRLGLSRNRIRRLWCRRGGNG